MTKTVAIHNKNGKGLLLRLIQLAHKIVMLSQSTIKMEKGYYGVIYLVSMLVGQVSQSTIKMEKGYYKIQVTP